MTRARRLLWPGLMTAVMLAGTIALGNWQVGRLEWKTNLLAELGRGEAAPAVTLTDAPAPFTKVRVEGRLRTDLTAFYSTEVRTLRGVPTPGARLVSPMERPGAVPVMVDRGWAPFERPPEAAPGVVAIEGYVRPAEKPVRFGAKDDPAARRFYALDPAAIGAALGLPDVAPFTLVALGPAVPGSFPAPVQTLPRPANNHLIYVITWYGLAASLFVIFVVYARKVLRP